MIIRRETQESIGEWNVATFGESSDPKPQALRLLAEVAELCQASGCCQAEVIAATESVFEGMGLKWTNPEPEKIPAELADVEIVAKAMAYRLEITLGWEVDKKMATNRARKWEINGDGVGQHINEGSEHEKDNLQEKD